MKFRTLSILALNVFSVCIILNDFETILSELKKTRLTWSKAKVAMKN